MVSLASTAIATPEDYAYSKLLSYAVYRWEGFKVAKHHRLIAKKLEAVERGEIKRLAIFMPPRHGKSMICSEFFPAWYLGRNPDKYIITATYSQEFAEDFGRKVRNQLKDPSYEEIFPGAALRQDSTSSKRFHTSQGGVYFAVGVGGPVTGRGAHVFLLDDVIKGREEADSPAYRRKLQDWFTSVAYTRLMPGGAIVLIMTRWRDNDLAGWLLKEQKHENWDVLSLPAIAEDDDPMGRVPGEALWPQSYPVDRLRAIKQTVGSRDWLALYQQRPSPQEGGIIKANWFKTHTSFEPFLFEYVIQSWDTAFKAESGSDFSACTTWGVKKDGFYLLEAWSDRVEFPELERKVKALASKYKPRSILIEDKASGQSLVQMLQRNSSLPILPIKVDRDKVARVHAIAPLFESGRVFIPETEAWSSDYMDQMIGFPTGAHDDLVDSTSQALTYMQRESYDNSWLGRA